MIVKKDHLLLKERYRIINSDNHTAFVCVTDGKNHENRVLTDHLHDDESIFKKFLIYIFRHKCYSLLVLTVSLPLVYLSVNC